MEDPKTKRGEVPEARQAWGALVPKGTPTRVALRVRMLHLSTSFMIIPRIGFPFSKCTLLFLYVLLC